VHLAIHLVRFVDDRCAPCRSATVEALLLTRLKCDAAALLRAIATQVPDLTRSLWCRWAYG
jgi:hypothetical protein